MMFREDGSSDRNETKMNALIITKVRSPQKFKALLLSSCPLAAEKLFRSFQCRTPSKWNQSLLKKIPGCSWSVIIGSNSSSKKPFTPQVTELFLHASETSVRPKSFLKMEALTELLPKSVRS
jgi:hypothetical protein